MKWLFAVATLAATLSAQPVGPPTTMIRAARMIDGRRPRSSARAIVAPPNREKFADHIAVPGDPLRDSTELARVGRVMNGGVVYRGQP